MRFIPIDFVNEGMTLAKPLYGDNGSYLLGEDAKLTDFYIKRIKQLGYNGVYIEDEISKGIEAKNLISDNLKNRSIQTLKKMFTNAYSFQDSKNKYKTAKIEVLIDKIIDEILDNDIVTVNLVDLKTYDDYTYYHSISVTTIALVLGVALSFTKKELYELGMAAIFHDIGKIFIDKDILNKKGKLNPEEFKEIQKHPYLGYRFLKDHASIPVKTSVAILQHHEMFDGNGYPGSKRGEDIGLYGRILAVVDVYDALTSERCYRKALMPSEAMEYLMGNGGIMFDPEIVKLFCSRVSPYPVGTLVTLSNNEYGIVKENFEGFGLRPKIELIDIHTKKSKNIFLDLHNNPVLINVTITGIAKI